MNYLELAGVRLAYQPRYAQTAQFFSAFSAPPSPAEDPGAIPVPVSIPAADWAEYLADGMEDCPHTEYSMLTEYFSDALLPHDRVILHGVALRRRDRAWLICAASGVGKSTQARFLQQLRPGDFGVICGDRPVLRFCHSERSEESASPVPAPVGADAHIGPQTSPACRGGGPASRPVEGSSHGCEILVHPSPWNGKENWHGAPAAPLAGIILLERGPRNRLYALTEQEAGIPFYNHMIQSAWEPENVRRVASMITRLLSAVPIWKLISNEVPASTELLLESVFS